MSPRRVPRRLGRSRSGAPRRSRPARATATDTLTPAGLAVPLGLDPHVSPPATTRPQSGPAPRASRGARGGCRRHDRLGRCLRNDSGVTGGSSAARLGRSWRHAFGGGLRLDFFPRARRLDLGFRLRYWGGGLRGRDGFFLFRPARSRATTEHNANAGHDGRGSHQARERESKCKHASMAQARDQVRIADVHRSNQSSRPAFVINPTS